MPIHILGIRHHGVGSAKMVRKRLAELNPDMILIEGPPELDEVLPYIGVSGLQPPVSIMIYNEKDTTKSTFYPYASFSPEWVATAFANQHKIPVRSMDLPANVSLATVFRQDQKPILEEKLKSEDVPEQNETELSNPENAKEEKADFEKAMQKVHSDPMSHLARLAGYNDSEVWWDYMFESNGQSDSAAEHFEAVMMAMAALREENVSSSLDVQNIYREAYMRQIIRKARQEMYDNIVVICGAWHGPALIDIEGSAKGDAKLIKSLPKVRTKLKASWIPWTNDRLSMYSGYGAGITSPGWYEHLWTHDEDIAIKWLTRVAELFREQGQDMSTAHVLEGYKLAMSLCQLRGKSHVTLAELNEAVLTVMCMGDAILLELIKKELIVGNAIGQVPDDIPKVPLQQDFEKTVKSLRLRLSAAPKDQILDLRKENELKRSVFFHQLQMLEIAWARPKLSRTKGTFKETWMLKWDPSIMISIIDKAYLGNTVHLACISKVDQLCSDSKKITEVSALLSRALPADLKECIDKLLSRIDELSTISIDVQDLMEALPKLITISRYGDVRKSDLTLLNKVVDRLLIRVFIGLPNACYGLDEENSEKVFMLISDLQNAIKINDNHEATDSWLNALSQVLNKKGVHDIILGCTCRLLLDAEKLSYDEATQKIGLALSTANEPQHVASWIEGFLKGSGMILIYDNRLWNLIYDWVNSLEKEVFMNLLPYLRRAFSRFENGERRQIGTKAKKGKASDSKITESEDEEGSWNEETAVDIFGTLEMLMGG
jgi:hypothetical protein